MNKSVGIYRILNTDTNKSYIGCSKDIQNRWKSHKYLLSKGNHHSLKLQRSWDKYGEGMFEFSVLELFPLDTDKQTLLEFEEDYIEKYDSFYNGYNCKITSVGDVYLSDWLVSFKELDSIECEERLCVWQCLDKWYVSRTKGEEYYCINSGTCIDREVNKLHFEGFVWEPILVTPFTSIEFYNYLVEISKLPIKERLYIIQKGLSIS